jgi:hypothetical protein
MEGGSNKENVAYKKVLKIPLKLPLIHLHPFSNGLLKLSSPKIIHEAKLAFKVSNPNSAFPIASSTSSIQKLSPTSSRYDLPFSPQPKKCPLIACPKFSCYEAKEEVTTPRFTEER